MFVIRPIKLCDLDKLETFAHATALGMQSLPPDRDLLRKKIERSMQSFATSVSSPGKELYLFVLEDTQTGEVGGTCAVTAKSGVTEPLYFFRVETIRPPSTALPHPEQLTVLHPTTLSQGPSELCTLYLTPEWRDKRLGIPLSRSRFLFIAAHLNRFDTTIMAVLRGVIGKTGKHSPFWDALGKQFLHMDFESVCDLIIKERAFIADFLPKHPIYAALLSKKAQQAIGKPRTTARPALKMLQDEGFHQTSEIDVIEAGPMIEAVTANIRTVKQSRVATVNSISDSRPSSGKYLLGNERLDFRACCCTLQTMPNGEVVISAEAAEALDLHPGDPVRYAPLYPKKEAG